MVSPHGAAAAHETPAATCGGGGSVLVVGSYCHDVLFRDGQIWAEGLGGAASFISSVLDPIADLGAPHRRHRLTFVSKVGNDFRYAVPHPPILSASSPTTVFHADLSSSPLPSTQSAANGGRDRSLRRVQACDPISPSDLPADQSFDFGLAVGVAGEVPPETLTRMLDICAVVLADAQSLIRRFDPVDGAVGLVPLRESGFFHLLPRIGFLKASMEEAPFVDIEEARRCCCVVLTQGEDGSRVCFEDGELRVLLFPAVQVDPTGAGDSFLGGFVAGLSRGLTIHDSALLGNLFGSLTVAQIGIPKFDKTMMQVLGQILDRMAVLRLGSCMTNGSALFCHSGADEEFRASLVEASKLQSCHNSAPSSVVVGNSHPEQKLPPDPAKAAAASPLIEKDDLLE